MTTNYGFRKERLMLVHGSRGFSMSILQRYPIEYSQLFWDCAERGYDRMSFWSKIAYFMGFIKERAIEGSDNTQLEEHTHSGSFPPILSRVTSHLKFSEHPKIDLPAGYQGLKVNANRIFHIQMITVSWV